LYLICAGIFFNSCAIRCFYNRIKFVLRYIVIHIVSGVWGGGVKMTVANQMGIERPAVKFCVDMASQNIN
jgi:hypothetical protein